MLEQNGALTVKPQHLADFGMLEPIGQAVGAEQYQVAWSKRNATRFRQRTFGMTDVLCDGVPERMRSRVLLADKAKVEQALNFPVVVRQQMQGVTCEQVSP